MRDTTVELDDKRNKIVKHCMALFDKESKKDAIEKIIEEYGETKEFKEKVLKDIQNSKQLEGKKSKRKNG